jgi:hypothetical protein
LRLSGRRQRLAAAGAGCILAAVAAVTVIATQSPAGANVINNGGGLFYGGNVTPPGLVADFPMEVENTDSAPVTLESATLVPLPGYPIPRLVHLGVLVEHQGLLTSAVGWPVWKAHSPSSTWQLRQLPGYVVLPWKIRQGDRQRFGPLPDMIEYGVLGAKSDTDYWVAGLRITYKLGANTYTQTLYDGAANCVGAVSFSKPSTFKTIYQKYCAAIDTRANKELEKIAPPG